MGLYSVAVNANLNWIFLLEVYTGSDVTNLALLGDPNAYGTATFQASIGTNYMFQVDDGGVFTMDIAPVPANDDFGQRDFVGRHELDGYRKQPDGHHRTGEPNHTGRSPGGHSVWYAWTAPLPGLATITAIGTNVTPVVDVYTGTSLTGLSPVGTNSASGVSLIVTAGTTYQIAVDGSGGFFALNLSMVLPPGNDVFENRFSLSGMNPSVQGTTYLATFQPG